jgi:hypothetical protein
MLDGSQRGYYERRGTGEEASCAARILAFVARRVRVGWGVIRRWATPWSPTACTSSKKPEIDLDHGEDGNGLPILLPRHELPFLHCLDRFLVQTQPDAL